MINFSSIYHVWLRNVLVWRKLAVPSLLGNVADPVMALMAFGLGLGSMIAGVNGQPYLNYLAVGAVCISAMNAATFEALYSAFSRMHVQKTWDAIMNTPVRLHEVVLGEWLWAGTKSAISTGAMMLIIALLGIGDVSFWFIGWFVLIISGLMFSALGLCVNARAPGFDFFMFYFTLAITPQTFLSGAFFPRENLPDWLSFVSEWLPLSIVVDSLRSIYSAQWSDLPALLFFLLVYLMAAVYFAVYFTQKRFNKGR
jgi:lipooligosaccharide transport system permease protein